MFSVPVCGATLHNEKRLTEMSKPSAALFLTGNILEQELVQDSNVKQTALPHKASGTHGMLLQASVSGHGGSNSLPLKWKRNVTRYFKANGFFHWLKHLPKIVTFIFPPNVSFLKMLIMFIMI